MVWVVFAFLGLDLGRRAGCCCCCCLGELSGVVIFLPLLRHYQGFPSWFLVCVVVVSGWSVTSDTYFGLWTSVICKPSPMYKQ